MRTRDGLLPVAVMALVALATIGGAWQTHRSIWAHERQRFDYEAHRVDAAISARMNAYVQVLRGGLGLFQASDQVTRADWSTYYSTLRLEERYPGFKSLSFAAAVSVADLPSFVDAVRAEPLSASWALFQREGLSHYAVWDPEGAAGEPSVHSPILYVAPWSAANCRVLGVDMMREPVRRAAMERAAEIDDAVLSPRLRLSGMKDNHAGFIAYLPVRRGQRLHGWLTAAFIAEDFMRGLLGEHRGALRYAIYAGAESLPRDLLHSTDGVGPDAAPLPLMPDRDAFTSESRVPVPGGFWSVHYVAPPGFVPLGERLAPWLVMLAGLLTMALLREQWRRAREHLAAIRQFFSPGLAELLQREPDLLEGRTQEVTVLMSDLRGYSQLVERLGPQETCKFVRDMMERLSNRILEHGGLIVDYAGDGILAMWNAPVAQQGHPEQACRAALEMLAEMPGLESDWREITGIGLTLGISINTGSAHVGNTGSSRKVKYGPHGHTVNLASRLQLLCKHLSAPLVVTAETRSRLPSELASRRLGIVRLPGIDTPIVVHELATLGPYKPDWPEYRDLYERAVEFYEAGRFQDAKETLSRLHASRSLPGSDLALKTVSANVQAHLDNPSAPFDALLYRAPA